MKCIVCRNIGADFRIVSGENVGCFCIACWRQRAQFFASDLDADHEAHDEPDYGPYPRLRGGTP